jgi:hypothetical protein
MTGFGRADGPDAARKFGDQLIELPRSFAERTSIAGGIDFSMALLARAPYESSRRTIDVSGDGTNNSGPLLVPVRDEVLAAGITINGLPIMLKRPNPSTLDIENLDIYYEDCVIGGPGSFVVGIKERAQFKDATRTKLVLEIAGHTPEPKAKPAQARVPRVYCS